MLISLQWIKEFTKIPDLSPKELGEKFTLATAEVEEVKSSGECWQKLQVAQIQSITPHPNADSLNLVTFSLGKSQHQVVCGAKNVKVGLKVPYAPIGVTLPNGMTLTPKSIRGVMSEGMLCSQEELGLPVTLDGLLEFPDDAPVGTNLAQYLNKTGGVIFDIDNKSLTHRPDLWGHYGMAREFATIFNHELKNPFDAHWQKTLLAKIPNSTSPITVQVESDCAGLCYLGLSLDQVSVAPSPTWMVERLEASGLRSINSLVDISNYVMLELGIPNHIFDRSKITGNKLRIHSLKQEQKFTTLDESERLLVAGDTVISDERGPLVLAGIMGGKTSAVDENTKSIFIEVANWRAAMVRRTSVRLGLRTDSSQRYEKSLDSQLAQVTLLRLLELILVLNPQAKIVGDMTKDGPDLKVPNLLIVSTSVASICRQLGKEIAPAEIERILSGLGFGVSAKNGVYSITVPSWRATKDVECEADIVEEIGRMIGYDNIAACSPPLSIAPVRLNPFQQLQRKIEDFMSIHGRAFQIMTYPLVGKKSLQQAHLDPDNTLKIINALSEDHDRMRTSLISSLLEAVEVNKKNYDEFRLFELGRVYQKSPTKDFVQEYPVLGMAFFHQEEINNNFMNTLNTLERLLQFINIPFEFMAPNPKFPSQVLPQNWHWTHPHEHTDLRVMGKVTGSVFTVHPLLLRQYKIKGKVTIALIDLKEMQQKELKSKIKYRPLTKFPSTTFDCTVLTAQDTPAAEVLRALDKLKLPELEWAKIVGVYIGGDKVPCITIRTYFIDRDKTLTSERIRQLESAVLDQLSKSGFPLKK
jgi:phenylalanyl-tRNA synthetase beta chain